MRLLDALIMGVPLGIIGGTMIATPAIYTIAIMHFAFSFEEIAAGGFLLGLFIGAPVYGLLTPLALMVLEKHIVSGGALRCIWRIMLSAMVPAMLFACFRMPWGALIGSVVGYLLGVGLCRATIRCYDGVDVSCESCGYDLRGSFNSSRCPECGHAIDEPKSVYKKGTSRIAEASGHEVDHSEIDH